MLFKAHNICILFKTFVFQLHRVFCLIINDIEIMYNHVTFHSHRTCNELQAFVALGDVNQTLAATIILYK
jgi:DNA-directed RNA polymerase